MIRGEECLKDTDVGLLNAPVSAGPLQLYGMKAYRGIRTNRYTYVRNENAAWLLFDNHDDPFQKNNLIGKKEARSIQTNLEELLREKLKSIGDGFQTSDQIIDDFQLQSHVDNMGLGSRIPWSYPWT